MINEIQLLDSIDLLRVLYYGFFMDKHYSIEFKQHCGNLIPKTLCANVLLSLDSIGEA